MKFKAVVSGCPRSGTSLMMLCLRNAFGEDSILGHEWPQLESLKKQRERRASESESEYEARLYLISEYLNSQEKEMQHFKNMNPNGFWECPYTVRGCTWHLGFPDISGKIVKIVSQGLANTNPIYVDKVIMMTRHPRQVAKSHENLRKMTFIPYEEESKLKVHTPQMFCDVTVQACRWILQTGIIPYHVDFDDLIQNPDSTLAGVREFLGEGNFSKHPVNPKLSRSNPEDIKHHLWEHASELYRLFLEKDYKGVVNYHNSKCNEISRENVITPCVRLGRQVAYNECKTCIEGKTSFVENGKKQSEKMNIDWANKPCMFKCLTDPLNEHVSMNETIENNHWKV
jgi:hypothetical protein